MKENIATSIKFNDFGWEVDTPNLIREACENSKGGIYRVCWNIFKKLLALVASRAAELNDPVMNVLMLKLNLYGDPKDGSPIDNHTRRELIKRYTNEIQYL